MADFSNIFSASKQTATGVASMATATQPTGKFSNIFANQAPAPTAPLPAAPAAVINFPSTMSGLAELQLDPLSLQSNPTKALSDAMDTVNKSAVQAGTDLRSAFNAYTQPSSLSTKIGTTAKAAASTAGFLLSPISAFFQAANDVPVIGTISKLITLPFNVVGDAAPHVSNALIDKLPISDSAKAALKPGIGQIFALAAQIELGEVVESALPSERAASSFRNDFTKENPAYKADLQSVGANTINNIVDKFGREDAGTIIKQAIDLAREKAGKDPLTPPVETLAPETIPATPAAPAAPAAPSSASPVEGESSPMAGTPTETSAAPGAGKFAQVFTPQNGVTPSPDESVAPTESPDVVQPKTAATSKTSGTDVTVNGKDYTLSGNAEQRYLRESTRSKDYVANADKFGMNSEGRIAKGEGMRMSALKRDLTGNYTDTELSNRIAQERGNYDGKQVQVEMNGRTLSGEIQGRPAYGKFKVQLADGSTITRTADGISDLRSNEDVINKITSRTDAKLKTAPAETTVAKTAAASVAPVAEAVPTKTTPVSPVEKSNTPVEGTGETKTRGLAQGIDQKAVEKKLTQGFGDLPEYKQVSMKDQAAKASDLLSKQPDLARQIAMGEKPAPEGILPEAVLVAVENKAINDGDVATLRDLATNSALSSEATTMGQRIRTLAERDPDSPVAAISDVIKAREAAVEKATGKKVGDAITDAAADIKASVKKVASSPKTWEEFAKSLQC